MSLGWQGRIFVKFSAAFDAKATGRVRQSEGVIAWINRSLGGLFVSASASECSRCAEFSRESFTGALPAS